MTQGRDVTPSLLFPMRHLRSIFYNCVTHNEHFIFERTEALAIKAMSLLYD